MLGITPDSLSRPASVCQRLSPPRENIYLNSSGQVETLTEQQKALIGSIGNTKQRSRLHDRTFKVFPREDRLDIIEFHRADVYIDHRTGEEHNILVASASEALYISKSTPERGIKNENKITSMNRGSARDDGNRNSSAAPCLSGSPPDIISFSD